MAHAPIRFVAEDGREAHFQRAMATVDTPVGIKGVGWSSGNAISTDAPELPRYTLGSAKDQERANSNLGNEESPSPVGIACKYAYVQV